jgi:ATP-dependent protease HslVU (ClpYQ) ATPase subunit
VPRNETKQQEPFGIYLRRLMAEAGIERLLDEISFDAPDCAGETFVITATYVDEKVGTLAGNADLSKFIL